MRSPAETHSAHRSGTSEDSCGESCDDYVDPRACGSDETVDAPQETHSPPHRLSVPDEEGLDMDDVVAVEVKLTDGSVRFFVTWGRIQETVDPGPLAELVLTRSAQFALGGVAESARVCGSLREAARSASAPYFYECLLSFSRQPVPDSDYAGWRKARAEAMAAGEEIAYCGTPEA